MNESNKHKRAKKKRKDTSYKDDCFDKYAGFFDLFSMEHSRRIDNGNPQRYGSFLGILLTLLLTAMIVLYSVQKIQILINKEDDRIILTELPYFYDDREMIGG